jgi:phosphoribosylformylglycinamidine cyclo-ligase
MFDSITKSVLDTIEDNSVSNSLIKQVGTPRYFSSVVNTNEIYTAITTDGVGSKVDHLIKNKIFDVIGIDCFAMNINDLICVGANPISFQDHITTTKDKAEYIPEVLSGIIESCEEHFVLLTGGETEILKETKFHISGSAVGTVQPDNLIDGSKVKPGDVLIGLESNGVHSNGWTVLEERNPELITKENLSPTRIYTTDINPLMTVIKPSAIINITGGGFRNLERIPKNVGYDIKHQPDQEVFRKLHSNFTTRELYSSFNMGVGMIVIVEPKDVEVSLEALSSNPKVIGQVIEEDVPTVFINGERI